MLNYEMFMEKLREAILNVSGWSEENVTFVPKEDCKFCSNGTPILKSSVHSF